MIFERTKQTHRKTSYPIGTVPNKWVISLEGGGLCINVTECQGRLNVRSYFTPTRSDLSLQNSLGSSTYFASTYDGVDQTYGGRSANAAYINPVRIFTTILRFQMVIYLLKFSQGVLELDQSARALLQW